MNPPAARGRSGGGRWLLLIAALGILFLAMRFLMQRYSNPDCSHYADISQFRVKRPRLTSKASWVKMGPLIGGLGNILFILMSSYGIAQQRAASLCSERPVQSSKLTAAFDFPVDIPLCPADLQCEILLETRGYGRFHPEFLEDDSACIAPRHYLQSFKYFLGLDLPFRLKYAETARSFVRESGVDACIHIRRTDMILHPDLNVYDEAGYLQNAMRVLRQVHRGKTLRFLVVTDDAGWVSSQSFLEGILLSPFVDFAADLALLANCPNLIITIGTFGWWGAFLNRLNGTIIYKPQPMGYCSESDVDFFPEHWTPVLDLPYQGGFS